MIVATPERWDSLTRRAARAAGVMEAVELVFRDFQGCGFSNLRIGELVPRMCCCVVFSCLAIIRIEGCLNSVLQQYSWNRLGLHRRGPHAGLAPAGGCARGRRLEAETTMIN